MKKILYLMGIDWHWIKQRPQIVAEMLSKDYDVTVAYYKEILGKVMLRKVDDEPKNSIPIRVIPYRDKSKILYLIQKNIFSYLVKDIEQYDIIWIGHPLLYRYIPKSYQGKIVYDCMDNHTALCNDLKIKKMIYYSENELMKRVDLVFTSSSSLKNTIERKYKNTSVLVRNGFIADTIHRPSVLLNKNGLRIGYFGTIAEWIDFSLLIKSLEKINTLEYYLWGPISALRIPQHPRLIFEGVVEHHMLWDKAKDTDCLIMPFIVNDIIEAVDPVKLYEYISMGKIIIAPYYEEIERFEPYVYFYHNENEMLQLLDKLQKKELTFKYTDVQQDEFLEDNTWERRYDAIRKNLMKIEMEENCEKQ